MTKKLGIIKLAHFEILISIGAIFMSGLALWFSLRTEKLASAPNVQVETVRGSRDHQIHDDKKGKWVGETVTITSDIVLRNFGKADVQIVNIRCEPLAIGSFPEGAKGWLAISDQESRLTDKTRHDFLYQFKDNPVLGIENLTIPSGAARAYKAIFEAETNIQGGKDFPNIRLIFILSNGQEVTILPSLDWVGVTSKF